AWDDWVSAADDLMLAEGYHAHRHLLARADRMEERHATGIAKGGSIPAGRVVECRRIGLRARERMAELLAAHGVLALPTMRAAPPRLGEVAATTYLTVPFNLVGLPAVALPVPRLAGGFPASLQLVGDWYVEESLLALAELVQTAIVW
ncbi:MAG: hypothetical protein GEV00_24385, partial [Actinophytocola sp.]|nr:hypothetical protein [Actinophytocola sp.]